MAQSNTPTDPVTGVKPVPAVMRAAAIMDLLSAHKAPLSLSEISRHLSLPKSSVHGLCHSLDGLGLLRLQNDGKFTVGPHVMQWANAYLSQNTLVDEFYRLLAADKNLDRFTVNLSSLHGTDVVYIACRNATAPLGVTFRIGMSLPAIYAATGKAILAALDTPQREAILQAPWPQPLTRLSVGNIQALREELVQVRHQGYSLDDGQVREGMLCLGAPIYNHRGEVEAGIALSMTKAEAEPELVHKVSQGVMALANHLSGRLGAAL